MKILKNAKVGDKVRKKKEDTTEYVKQWNEQLKQELKQSVKAYTELCEKYKQLKAEFNELKEIERQHNKLNGELRKKINELQNNRDKAIEYFKFENPEIFKNPKYTNHLWTIDGLTIKRFIDILKGDSDE